MSPWSNHAIVRPGKRRKGRRRSSRLAAPKGWDPWFLGPIDIVPARWVLPRRFPLAILSPGACPRTTRAQGEVMADVKKPKSNLLPLHQNAARALLEEGGFGGRYERPGGNGFARSPSDNRADGPKLLFPKMPYRTPRALAKPQPDALSSSTMISLHSASSFGRFATMASIRSRSCPLRSAISTTFLALRT